MTIPGSLDVEWIVEPALAVRQGIAPSQLDPAVLVRQLGTDGVRL